MGVSMKDDAPSEELPKNLSEFTEADKATFVRLILSQTRWEFGQAATNLLLHTKPLVNRSIFLEWMQTIDW